MGTAHLAPLIDCDVLQYRCGFAADGQMKREALAAEPDASPERLAEMLDSVDYLHMALHNVREVIDGVTAKYTGEPTLFIHGGGNFREQIATLKVYKGNRDKTHKPKYAKEICNYLVDRYGAELVVGQESDDAIGIAQCSAAPGSTIIVSNDKDMDMIPGYHYNWVKDEEYFVQDEEADKMLFWQMLVGDNTDNIPGIPKIGPKTASKLLADVTVDQARDVVRSKYQQHYGTDWEQYYREVGSLLWIRREPNQECALL